MKSFAFWCCVMVVAMVIAIGVLFLDAIVWCVKKIFNLAGR